MKMLRLSALVFIVILQQQAELADADTITEPLVFDFMKDDPQRVKIFWSPKVSVKKVKELKNRDVQYIRDNSTKQMTEKYGEWHLLVSEKDDDDGTKRYVFLKKSLCHEADWMVSWIDENGKQHGPITQRLGPSPLPWAPTANISIKSLSYDRASDTLKLATAWTMEDERLQGGGGGEKLTKIQAMGELKDCASYFSQFLPAPVTGEDGTTVTLPADYARHNCSVWIRLSTITYNENLQCRDMQETRDSISLTKDLLCPNIPGLPCPSITRLPCKMDCNLKIDAVADYRTINGAYPEPYVNIRWSNSGRPVAGYLIRHTQIDMSHMNYPRKEFNVTINRLGANQTSIDFDQYSKDPGASYSVQACALYESCTGKEPDWKQVPMRRVRFNDLIYALPPPTTTAPVPITEAAAEPETEPETKTKGTAESEPEPASTSAEAEPKGDSENAVAEHPGVEVHSEPNTVSEKSGSTPDETKASSEPEVHRHNTSSSSSLSETAKNTVAASQRHANNSAAQVRTGLWSCVVVFIIISSMDRI